jgi:hypothetical protein
VIVTTQVVGNSVPIHLNAPVAVLSTFTVLAGLILISTLGSRVRRIRPSITRSPRRMLALVTKISADALIGHAATRQVAVAAAALTSFESIVNILPNTSQISPRKCAEGNHVREQGYCDAHRLKQKECSKGRGSARSDLQVGAKGATRPYGLETSQTRCANPRGW